MKTKFEDVTNLAGLVIICLTIGYCVHLITKCAVACAAVKAGAITLKTK